MPEGCFAALLVLSSVPLSLGLSASFGDLSAHAQGVIQNIRVEGNKRVEPETVRSYLTFTAGDAYDPAQIDESLKALFATGLFQDVRIRREGSTVVIVVEENPIVARVAFEGNREVEDDTLASEVQLKARAVYTRARVQADVQRILDVYRRQGYYAAAVNPKIINLDNNRIDVVFEINEGPTTKIRAINFIGNEAFSDSQLRFVISTTQDQPAQLPQGHQHLRSRPLEPRPRAAASVLSEERLCRCPHCLGDRRSRPRRARLFHHLHHQRGRALPLSAPSTWRARSPRSMSTPCGDRS